LLIPFSKQLRRLLSLSSEVTTVKRHIFRPRTTDTVPHNERDMLDAVINVGSHCQSTLARRPRHRLSWICRGWELIVLGSNHDNLNHGSVSEQSLSNQRRGAV
jgi:hypothetical protein